MTSIEEFCKAPSDELLNLCSKKQLWEHCTTLWQNITFKPLFHLYDTWLMNYKLIKYHH